MSTQKESIHILFYSLPMISFIPASSRGQANHGWLQTAYSFSFSTYYDPTRMHFGVLRVLNDDIIAGDNGFPEHPHDNMEIITIVLSGALEHKDDMGNGGVIRPGDVQVMSAGEGVHHSEFNPSPIEPVSLFQLWIYPHTQNIASRYDQASFDWQNMKNDQKTLVSSDNRPDSLLIHANASVTMGVYEANQETTYVLNNAKYWVFLMCVEWSLEVNGHKLGRRDVLEITDMTEFPIKMIENSQWMAIEVEM